MNDWQVDTASLTPQIGSRVGISLLVLGLMHFFNMVMIARIGRAVKAWAQDLGAGA